MKKKKVLFIVMLPVLLIATCWCYLGILKCSNDKRLTSDDIDASIKIPRKWEVLDDAGLDNPSRFPNIPYISLNYESVWALTATAPQNKGSRDNEQYSTMFTLWAWPLQLSSELKNTPLESILEHLNDYPYKRYNPCYYRHARRYRIINKGTWKNHSIVWLISENPGPRSCERVSYIYKYYIVRTREYIYIMAGCTPTMSFQKYETQFDDIVTSLKPE